MSTTLDRRMNLVIDVESDDGKILHIHSTPVSRQVFEQYFLVISKTYAAIFSEGLGPVAGPAAAYLMLKQKATEMGQWEQIRTGFINEIVRLSNVAIQGAQGWDTLPLHTAIERKLINDEDLNTVEGELVFFTLVVLMNKRALALGIMNVVNGLWGSALTSLDFTGYRNSLPISTQPETSGETPTTLLVPH